MKRIASLFLVSIIVFGCFLMVQTNAHAYPSNYGQYSIDYINDLNSKYKILSEDEIDKIDQNADATLDFVLMLMSRVHYSKEHPNNTNYPKNYIQYCFKNGIFDDYLDNYQVPLTRGAFAQILINSIKNRDMLEINVVNDGTIPDIDDDYQYKDAVYMSYRYGFFNGCDNLGTFDTESPIKNSHVLALTNRIFNPNLRTTVTLYSDINIQSDIYPMTYINNDTGLNITINKERHYDTDCYIANIVMSNPAHIKTIYSDLEWTNYGCEASTFNQRINSIFMVNGDFRNAEFGEKLGIVRNREIVNNKKFSNVLGIDLSGNLKKVNYSNAQAVIKNDIRDTWTFGPWLVENGRINNLNNEARAPRTFIGQVKRGDGYIEYIIVVADGRSKVNAGLTMKECANILKENNCYIGYNLDGGGSSVMMFNGKVLNDPCYGERADIDYIYIK